MLMLSQSPNPRVTTGLTSTSLDRAPGPSKSFVRGKSGYVPFWPGGLDDVLLDVEGSANASGELRGLRSVPPGFKRGLRLPGDEAEDETLTVLDEISGTRARQPEETVISCFQPCRTCIFSVCVLHSLIFALNSTKKKIQIHLPLLNHQRSMIYYQRP